MRMRVLTTKLRVEIENEMRVFLESLNFEIEMRVSQKSVTNVSNQKTFSDCETVSFYWNKMFAIYNTKFIAQPGTC